MSAQDLQHIIHKVLSNAHLSQTDINYMFEAFIREMDTPSCTTVSHHLEPQGTALREDVVKDLYIDHKI